MNSTGPLTGADAVGELYRILNMCECVVIGAGAGLSASAGYIYNGGRFEKYFSDFRQRYGFADMYSGGFYPYKTPEEFWAYWSRYIYINRYLAPPKPVYSDLLELVGGRDYFVITTNVDHCFQRAGFDKMRLFYTQGDYGLWQCSKPCHLNTYDNADTVRRMLEAQGYVIGEGGELSLPAGTSAKMLVPSSLVPRCPVCGRPMSMNLRSDSTFVEDDGWHAAARRYADFLDRRRDKPTLFLELGVGQNTPGIIKYSFWQMTCERKNALYACINSGEACAPQEISQKSLLIEGDVGAVLSRLRRSR